MLSDTFTGSNGTLLSARNSDSGHAWTKVSGDTDNRFEINGNRAMAAGSTGAEYISAWTPAGPNYYAQAVTEFLSGTAAYYEMGVRVSPDGEDGYFVTWNEFTDVMDLVKKVGGVDTTLDTIALQQASDTIRLVADGESISVLRNDVEILAATDSAVTAAGGVWLAKYGGPGSNDGWMFESISADDIAAPEPTQRISARVKIGGAMVATALLLLVALLPTPASDEAWLWVDPDGGSCEVYDPPDSYVDGEACDWEEAFEAAESGWTVRVKAGTYAPVSIGDRDSKFAPVKFIGEDGAIIDSDTAHNQGLGLNGMVTVDNVDVTGDTPFVYLGGRQSTWRNATFHEGAEGMAARSCANNDAEPILIYQDNENPTIRNATLQNIVIEEQHHRDAVDDTCPGGDLYHLELLRIDQNVDGVLIDRVFFSGCADCGSGLMFITTPSPAVPGPRNITVRNSIFEATTAYSFQMSANVDDCHGYVFAYNTFEQDNNISCSVESSDVKWIGNLGPRPVSAPCKDMQFIRNVWQAQFFGFDFHCGSDTIVWGAEYATDELGLDENWRLEEGSPAIDSAETPGPSDYCTGPLASQDIDGDARPVGAACDAGADEWQG